MMQRNKMAILAVVLLGLAHPVLAAPQSNECSGILHRDQGFLQFGGGAHESEGICVVAKSEQGKVLQTCQVGRFCHVTGRLNDCKDSGECSEITGIKSVTAH